MRRAVRAWYACVAMALLAACGVSADEPARPGDDTLAYIESLGFSPDSIDDQGEYLLVEGDIVFRRDRPVAGRISRQGYNNAGLVGAAAITNVTVAIDGTIPVEGVDDWHAEVQQAIEDWNGIGGARLHFTYTTDLGADVIVRDAASVPGDQLPNNVIAAGDFPIAGRPGIQIRINLTYNGDQVVPTAQKHYNMVHELGHVVGLRHTNWSAFAEDGVIAIPGTPCVDDSSVMNGGTAAFSWTRFSFYDREALRAIYPIARPAGVFPLLRYYNAGTGDHFYTIFYGELGCGGGGYQAEGTEGYIFQNPAAGTVPLYRYWSGTFGDHFYTLTPGSYSTYISEGVAGHVYPGPTPTSLPIFGYYHAGLHDHLYTQYGTSAAGYALQGVTWYAER